MGIGNNAKDERSVGSRLLLYFDLDAKRTERVTEYLTDRGDDVVVVSSVDGAQWLSILELVQYDAIVLEAQGEAIAVARRLVTELIGPQGTTVIPTLLMVSPEHTLPFSAAIDLPVVELPCTLSALSEAIDTIVRPIAGVSSNRDRQQMATVSLEDIAIRATASLDIIARPPASMPRAPESRARRSIPWIAAGIAAAAAAVALIGSSTASQAPMESKPVPVARNASATPTSAERIAAPMAPAARIETGLETGVALECPKGMVFIDGRTFQMGTDDDNPVLTMARPAHSVEVEGFCIDRTEVTVEDYRECSDVGECKRAHRDSWWPQGQQDPVAWERSRQVHGVLCNERYDDRGQHPINCVSWDQANHYCERKGMHLPTEAQWELAARDVDGRRYPWGDQAPDSETLNGCGLECQSWRRSVSLPVTSALYDQDDGFEGTAPVGSFPAGHSAAGVADLAGNVFEWTADPFVPYVGSTVEMPAEARDRRVIRGGAFNSFRAEFADPALRFGQHAEAHAHGIGFRCVASPT